MLLFSGCHDYEIASPKADPAAGDDSAADVTEGESADLEVAIEAVCAEGCEEDVHVTVYVANAGSLDAWADVVVRTAHGTAVATERVAALAAGTARAVTVRVPVADAGAGLEAEVDPTGAVRECDESDNVASWTDTPCP